MSKNISAKVGEYEKDGEKKGRYVNIGVILENNNGEYVLLDPTVNLAGVLIQQRLLNPQKSGDKVIASIFDNSRQAPGRSQAANSAPESRPEPDDFDDDIPF